MLQEMLRLLFMLHAYPPYHNAGAETYLHNLAKWLTGRGHDVKVLTRDPLAGLSEWEGVKLGRRGPVRWTDREVAGRIVVTHLDETPIAEAAAARTGRPLVHVLHNDRQLEFHHVRIADLLVANSEWLLDHIPERFTDTAQTVLYPPTFVDDYDTDPEHRSRISLVNLLDGKGAPLFYELARRLPDREFWGISGAYGAQKPAPALPNLEIRPNRPDMGPVWEETRILLAPSVYESYGKAAVEALASGIPVIAHPTEGLSESLGTAGIFCDREDPDAWVAAIENLDDSRRYRAAARRARSRAEELEKITIDQLTRLEELLETL